MGGRRRLIIGAPRARRWGPSGAYRGSRKRLRRLKWHAHTSVELWIFVVLVLIMFSVGLSRLFWHPAPAHDGSSEEVPHAHPTP
jgi:hypothetical protein